MALIDCPECGSQVSDKAESCPKCGYGIVKEIVSPRANPVKGISRKSKGMNGFTLAGIILASLLLIFIVVNALSHHPSSGSGTTTDTFKANTYQEKIKTVEEIEREQPSRFLEASGTYNQNFWGDKMKVHGTIRNNATVANYKDVVVEVIFYSKTETELDRKRYKIYDLFPAHSSKPFELKIERPGACEKLGWEAVSATSY
jgi:hypothetical protein